MNNVTRQLVILSFFTIGVSWDIDYVEDSGEAKRELYLANQIKTRQLLKHRFRTFLQDEFQGVQESIHVIKLNQTRILQQANETYPNGTNLIKSLLNPNCLREIKFKHRKPQRINTQGSVCGGNPPNNNGTIHYSLETDESYPIGTPIYICIWTSVGYNITNKSDFLTVKNYDLNFTRLFHGPNIWNYYPYRKNLSQGFHNPLHTVAVTILVVSPLNDSHSQWPKFTQQFNHPSKPYSLSPGSPAAFPHIRTYHFTNSIGVIDYTSINTRSNNQTGHEYSLYAIYPLDMRKFEVTMTSFHLSNRSLLYITLFIENSNSWEVFQLVSDSADSTLISDWTINIQAPQVFTELITHAAFLTLETTNAKEADSLESFRLVWKPS